MDHSEGIEYGNKIVNLECGDYTILVENYIAFQDDAIYFAVSGENT